MNARPRVLTEATDAVQRPAPKFGTALANRAGLVQLWSGARSVVPYAEFAAQRLGRAGILGVALVVFSAVGVVSTNSTLRDQIGADSATLERLSQDTGRATVVATPHTSYDRFVNELPTRDDVPELMQQIVAVATTQGVSLDEGRYEIVASSKSDRLARYRMSFPVTGSYPQVRAFINGALAAVPSMSLDGLRVRRKDIGVGVVGAELDFVVFVRASK